VLGGDRTAERSDEGEHGVLVAAIRGGRGNDVDVYVAVGDMAERDHPGPGIHLRDHAGGRGREPHPSRRRHGDVELDRNTEEPGRLGLAFPEGPQPASFGRGRPHGGVRVGNHAREIVERGGARSLEQEISLRWSRQRRHQAGVLDEDVQSRAGEELGRDKSWYLPGRLMSQRVEFSQAAEPDDRGDRVPQPRDQPEPGLGDEGQGALGPGQQRRVVIAGVVLDQPGQMRHDGAVGEDGLYAEQLRPHRPVAQDPYPAGVGRHGPADGRAVLAGDLDAEIKVGVGVRDLLQGRPGTGGDLSRLAVDRAHVVQASRAQDDLTVQRHTAADQAGVPPLRDDRHAGVGAQGQDGRDLGGIAGPDHGGGLAPESSREVNRETRGRFPGQDMLPAHDADQGFEHRARKRFHPTAPP
jgi:hypothetical protein